MNKIKEEELNALLEEMHEVDVSHLDKRARDLFHAIMQIADERDELRQKLEMQENSNKLLCKAIMCEDCDCSVCEAHKQQIRLEEQLKQRDEVIDKAINKIEDLRMEKWSIQGTDIMDLLDILQTYKGDNNENN